MGVGGDGASREQMATPSEFRFRTWVRTPWDLIGVMARAPLMFATETLPG